jgi:DNA-binding transcriptional LysR family regulator
LRKYPELEVEFITCDRPGDIVADGYDLVIRFGQPRPSTLVVRKLLETRVLVVAAPAYLKRYVHPRNPSKLRNGKHAPIDFRDPETSRTFEWVFPKNQKKVPAPTHAQLLLTDVVTMHGICVAGYGIAQVLELGVESLLANGRLVKLFPEPDDELFPLNALYPSRKHLPPKTRTSLILSSLQSAASRGRLTRLDLKQELFDEQDC